MPSFSLRPALGPLLLIGALSSVAACGGIVVFDDVEGTGGAGGAPTTSVVTSVSVTSVSSTSTVEPVGGGGPNLVEAVLAEQVTNESLAMVVDDQTLGVTAVGVTANDFGYLEIPRLYAPSGAVLIDGALPSNGAYWLGYGALALAAPLLSHPESFPLARGEWRFDFTANSPSRVTTWTRRTVDGQFHGGVLDVNVFVADGVVAEDYALESLEKAFDDFGGVSLGDVRFFALPPGYYDIDENNMYDLVRETRVMPTRPALNVMAVGNISGLLEGAAGFALGVPGTPMLAGEEQSAVVWMVFYNPFDPVILRHEAGHLAGLFHTSEFEPGLIDPLDDTPFCEDVLELYETCPDLSYIMFPTGGEGPGLFSPLQGRVIQGGAMYRGRFAPGEPPMPPYGPALNALAPRAEISRPSALFGKLVTAADRARPGVSTSPRRLAPTGRRELQARGLSAASASHLGGLGCPHEGHELRDYYATLESLGGFDAQALADVAFDAKLPAHARSRALGALARMAERGETTPLAVTSYAELAARASEPGQVRASALSALARLDRGRAGTLAASLRADGDARVRAAAERLR